MEAADAPVEHNEADQRFEIRRDGQLAVNVYRRAGSRIAFLHTEVPDALEGQGLAARLAQAGLEFARAHDLRVRPLCPYVAAYIRRHPEYDDLVE